MEVSITQFRRDLFTLVNQAMDGTEVWVTHKGRRFRIAPESKSPRKRPSKFDRMTPMDIINEDVPESAETAMKEEMRLAWEKDWEDI